MICTILTAPNQILNNSSVCVEGIHQRFRLNDLPESGTTYSLNFVIDSMLETMIHNHGIGLAACQIGININLFVAQDPYTGKKKVFINPHIVPSVELASMTEGCLSVPGIYKSVNRPSEIEISYRDKNFNEHTERYDGLMARICLHEYD